MSINFDHLTDKSRLYPVSTTSRGTGSTQIKESVQSEYFLNFFKKVMDNPKQTITQHDHQSQSGLKTQKQKALELHKRMEMQMNESLLGILSDSEKENNFEQSLINNPLDIFSMEAKMKYLVPNSQQDTSKIEHMKVQETDPIVGKVIKETIETKKYSNNVHEIDSIIQKAAATYNMDAELIRSVIKAESSFNPDAVSSKGATGLMQLMPATAKELGVTNSLDPAENVMGGTRYLKQLLDHYDQNVPLALAAYNGGIGNMESRRSKMPLETKNYVAKITGIELT